MIDKIKNYVLGDNLFFQKAGLAVGVVVGIFVGLFISDKADGHIIEVQPILLENEEVVDETQNESSE